MKEKELLEIKGMLGQIKDTVEKSEKLVGSSLVILMGYMLLLFGTVLFVLLYFTNSCFALFWMFVAFFGAYHTFKEIRFIRKLLKV